MPSIDSYFVTRTMRTLEVLAFQPASASQIADVLGVDARTARRLLNRLTDEGWLTRTDGRIRTYTLSLRLVALAANFAERAPLTRAGLAAIDALHDRTGATAHLYVPSYRFVLCLVHRNARSDEPPSLRELVPAHACAAGKVLLAHRQRWLDSVLELPLERLTDRTITDPLRLRRQCDQARQCGFADERGEFRDGLYGVAAPVRDGSGDVVAAVGLTGSDRATIAEHAQTVQAAAELQAALGWEPHELAA
jgi:IclR family transcriptional regulator, KDG regulon repressor